MKVPPGLDKLAKHVAEKAISSETPFVEALDALKNLTAYYALLLKNEGKSVSHDADGPTLSGLVGSLAPDNEEPLNGRRKRGASSRMGA